tara:strand:- start:532 stop:882 length:351 start_codon:yes stop_codon:yes gene_type:complete
MLYNNIWHVSWNKNEYNFEKLIEDFKKKEHNGLIMQEKGLIDEIIEPDVNDTVFISCNNIKILRCIIISINIKCNVRDKYSIKNDSEIKNYNLIKIQQIYNDEMYMKNQKNIWKLY